MADITKMVLQNRVVEVETKIAEVTAQRKELEENAKNTKAEVHHSIGCQLEKLRQREVQLTRQVDALIGHQGSMLQLQLAKLYQELGSLRSAQAFGHQGEFLACTTSREPCPSVVVRHLHYSSAFEEELSSAIQSFGRFEAALGSKRPSVLLLPDEEAYEDSDHHLMHKTLEDKMQWSFPKPPQKRDEWIQHMKMEDFEMSDSESIELLCPSEIQDKEFWLLNNKNTTKSCTCEEKGTIEIENLGRLDCATHGRRTKDELKTVLPIPDVANTCLTSQSSKCTSFRDCTCPENCLLTHLREQTRRLWLEEPQKKQDCINNTLREALRVDRNLWLNKAARRNDRSEWLLRRPSVVKSEERLEQPPVSENCQKLKKQMNELFFDTENSQWLSNKRVKSNEGWVSSGKC